MIAVWGGSSDEVVNKTGSQGGVPLTGTASPVMDPYERCGMGIERAGTGYVIAQCT